MRPQDKFFTLAGLSLVVLTCMLGCGPKRNLPEAGQEASQQEAVTPVVVTSAETGSIRLVETMTGTVEPLREVDVTCEVSGKIAWVGPEVGERVSRGAALVRLDTALASDQERQSRASHSAAEARVSQSRVGLQLTDDETMIATLQARKNLENARTRLKQAQTTAELSRTRVEDGIAQARIALNSARTRLAEVKAGSRSQEVAQAAARLEAARSALRLAKADLARAQGLAQAGAVAPAQLDAAEVAAETAQAQVRIAEQALDLAKEGARSEEVRLAELAVTQAEQVLATAEAQRGQVDIAERDVRNAELAVAQAEDGVRLAEASRRRVVAQAADVRAAQAGARQAQAGATMSQTQLRKHTVYAPLSGEVAARNVEPGEAALPGTSLLRLVVMDTVRVVAEVSDLQVARLRVGQVGTVQVDGLPGLDLHGRITDIAPQARDGKRVFAVRFEIPNRARKLRAGMFARIEVVTGVHPEAVIIPRDGLVERGEKRMVYAVENGTIKVRTVTVGAIDGRRVEIARGLKAGAVIVINGQNALADGQRVEARDGTAAESGTSQTSPATGP